MTTLPTNTEMESETTVPQTDDETAQKLTPEDGSDTLPSLTPSVRKFIYADRDNECELCGASDTDEDKTLEIHHRVPRKNGGTDHPHNLLLICTDCHRRHHGNQPIEKLVAAKTDETATEFEQAADQSSKEQAAVEDTEPLPPRSKPNSTDLEILEYVENHGPASTGELASALEYSGQYIRRQCWKLSGEQLIVPQNDDTWELKEKASDEKIQIGLPDDPKRAKRAGRDEVIRRMSAHGMAHAQIVEITGYSRTTIDFAVNRARALQIEDVEDTEVGLETIATRLSALLELIDQAQFRFGAETQTLSRTTGDN